HETVLDAVVDHLDEAPGAAGTAMHVAALDTRIATFAVGRDLYVARAGSQGAEDRIEAIDRFPFAPDHQAVATIEAPDAAAGAAIDILNTFDLQGLCPPYVVLVEGVAAIDDGVARLKERAQLRDRGLGDFARRQHDPDRPW